MSYRLSVFLMFLFCVGACKTQSKAPAQSYKLSSAFVDQQLRDAVVQIKKLAEKTPANVMPRTFQGDTLVTSNTAWWTSGFYPGTLLYLYEYSGDEQLMQLARPKLQLLEKEKLNKRTHDLGFMLYCSFGNAMRITKDTSAYREILITGAESLSSRYKPEVKAIRSWGGWNYPVIIDNMMNLEFLFAASRLSGNPKYRDIALTHANTTMQNHFRPDYSSYHVIDYNPDNGAVIAKKTFQGAYDESAWTRGQAWALYGYTMMYRETGDKKYLDLARNIAGFILKQKNWPADMIPYWDFNAPDIPADSAIARYRTNRDASSAAIMASAFIELSTFTMGSESSSYIKAAEKMLQSLSTPRYKAAIGTNGGFILKESAGNLPKDTEVDVPLTYADYYYVEALLRYKKLSKQ